MTTLSPRSAYTQDELKQLYPETLALQQVQIAGLPAYWPYCDAARHLKSVIKASDESWDDLAYRRKLETFDSVDDSPTLASGPAQETNNICLPGELTDLGRDTTLALGKRLRHLYVNQLKFMPGVLDTTENIYLRATPIPRALESVQQTFYGMYPPTARSPGFETPTIVSRQPNDETLFPNESGCRRFAQLSQAFAQRTADRWNDSSDMAYLTNLIGKWMPEESRTVKVDSHPRLSGIMDTVNSTLAHGKPTKLPKEFYDAKGRAIIDKIGVEEWFSGYTESKEYRMLGIGGLAGDIVSRMIEKSREPLAVPSSGSPQDVKFALSGCHDTTLAALLSSLGAFPGEPWPPYTSHIAIELFKKREPSTSQVPAMSTKAGWWSSIFGSAKASASSPRTPITEYTEADKQNLDGWYVRLRYNDRVMSVPGCRPVGKHYGDDESLCTLTAFKTIVDKFTPPNWKKACGARLGQDAFPESVEPAGI
ncbi:hypothetical protein AAFC00_003074 [Neodothiora populina]|uniref:Acid phosphatase n=1 Tax=Neodothiora populina TaxID=2781224 RepID=A0ABR3P981_9PEZI